MSSAVVNIFDKTGRTAIHDDSCGPFALHHLRPSRTAAVILPAGMCRCPPVANMVMDADAAMMGEYPDRDDGARTIRSFDTRQSWLRSGLMIFCLCGCALLV